MNRHGKGSHAKYLGYWGQVRKQLRAQGKTPKEADAMRHQFHVRALGRDKSSLDFRQADYDEVFKHFLAFLKPDDLEAQLALLERPEQRMATARQSCRLLVGQLDQIKAAMNPDLYAENYLNSLSRKVRGVDFGRLDEAGLGVVHGILKDRLNPVPDEGDPF